MRSKSSLSQHNSATRLGRRFGYLAAAAFILSLGAVALGFAGYTKAARASLFAFLTPDGSKIDLETNKSAGLALSKTPKASVAPMFACTTPPTGIAGWYQAENDALDFQNGNNGTLENGTTFAAGKVGQAFGFDGTNDSVLVPSMNLGNSYTIEFWLNPNATQPSFGHLISNAFTSTNYGALYITSTRSLAYWHNNAQRMVTASTLTANQWSHIALTRDDSDGKTRIYINGVLAATTGASFAAPFNNQVRLGYATSASDSYYKGLMDEVSFYNATLSVGDIQSIINAGTDGKCVSSALRIVPTGSIVLTGAAKTFSGRGGTPPYSFSIPSNNSGGSIDSGSGVYTAGPNAGTDTIRVTDSTSSTAETTIGVSTACVAGQKKWVGLGLTNNWSEPNNWSCQAIPLTTDIITFDGTSSKNAAIDSTVILAGFNINSGYAGTISQGSSNVKVSFGNFSQSAGIYNVGTGTFTEERGFFTLTAGNFTGSNGNMIFEFSTVNLDGGTFTAASGNTTSNGSTLNFNGSTFDPNNGTMTFASYNGPFGGNCCSRINIDGASAGTRDFFNVNFEASDNSGSAVIIGDNDTVRVNGTTNFVEGDVNKAVGNIGPGFSQSIVEALGDVVVSSSYGNSSDAVGTAIQSSAGTALLKLTGNAVRTITVPSNLRGYFNPIELNAPNTTVTTSGTGTAGFQFLTLMSGTVDTGTTTFSLDFYTHSQSGGSFVCGTGTTIFDGGSFTQTGGTLDCSAATALNLNFHNLTLNGGSYKAPSSLLNYRGGNFNRNAGTFDPNGGTVTFAGYTGPLGGNCCVNLNFDGASQGTQEFFNVIFDNPNGNDGARLSRTDIMNVRGELNLVDGTLISTGALPLATIAFERDLTVASTWNGGDIKFLAQGNRNHSYVNNGGAQPTGDFEVNKSGGIFTLASSLTLPASQPLKITDGTLYANSGSNLTAGAVTIDLNGRLVSDSATTITLGGTLTNNGKIDLQGSGSPCPEADSILIRSSVNGTQRAWNGSGQFRLVDVDVKDMAGTLLAGGATKSVFSGTNTGNNNATWVFSSNCPAPVSISPLTVDKFVGQTQSFSAGGSFAPFTFSPVSINSGGNITSGGLYTAGTTPNTVDTVRVTDAFGATADATVNVLAVPIPQFLLTVNRTGTGGGFVSSSPAGINCGVDCSELYDSGTVVTLTASADTTSTFNGWSGGGCSGTGTCVTTINTATTVTATFTRDLRTLSVALNGFGIGTVASNPTGINCTSAGGDCTEDYPVSTSVDLTGTPSTGDSRFHGWTGCDLIIGNICRVSMTSARSVTATFDPNFSVEPVEDVNSTAPDGTYGLGSVIDIQVRFHVNVNVSGIPQLALNSGGIATYVSGSGTNTLTFVYTVIEGHFSPDLDYNSTSSLTLNGGTIIYSGTTLPATLTLPSPGAIFSLGHHKAIVIDPQIIVSNTNNSGAGSLRDAITVADFRPGIQIINFNIPGTVPHTILLPQDLPDLRDVIVDATTQPGYSGAPIIEIKRANTSTANHAFAMYRSTVRGFAINGFLFNISLRGDNNVIQGNYIGTNLAGTAASGATQRTGIDCIRFFAPTINNTLIGGPSAADRNVISGNDVAISIDCSGTNNAIQGNYIGTNSSGTAAIPNGNGISISSGTTSSAWNIGGDGLGETNVVAFNTGRGISVNGSSIVATMRRNLFSSNGNIGVDLRNDGVSLNDPGDPDAGPDAILNYPVLTRAVPGVGVTTIEGTLNSRPSQVYTIDLYSSAVCDASGWGEGELYVGSTTVSSDATGIVSFSTVLPVSVPNGRVITATATQTGVGTSEFSKCVVVAPIFSISGTVLQGSTPVANAEVTISGSSSRSTITNSSGAYSFSDLRGGGNFTVAVRKPNFTFTPPTRSFTNLSSNQSAQNFSGTQPHFKLRGRVNIGANRLNDVTLILSGDANQITQTRIGDYAFFGVPSGNYTVTPSKPFYSFTPASRSITVSGSDINFADFSATLDPALTGRILSNNGRVMNADGSDIVELPRFRGGSLGEAAFSRDGGRITFVSRVCPNGPCSNPPNRMYVADLDGSNPIEILAGASTTETFTDLAWSPDGTQIAFIFGASAASGGSQKIKIVNVLNSTVTTVFTPAARDLISNLSWSPDSLSLAFTKKSSSSVSDIFTINKNGLPATLKKLTSSSVAIGQNSKPAWSPDGTRIAYIFKLTSNSSGGQVKMLTLNPDGTVLSNDIVAADQFFTEVAWSPDGLWLGFNQLSTAPSGAGFGVMAPLPNSPLIRRFAQPITHFSWVPTFGATTPTGSSVVTTAGAVSINFGTVTTAGTTTVTPIPTTIPASLNLPTGLFSVGQYGAWEVSTTAAYSPPVNICFNIVFDDFTANAASRFNRLKIMHIEGNTPVDRTISHTFTSPTTPSEICASVTSFSPFLFAEQADPLLPRISGLVVDSNGDPMPDVPVTLTGSENRSAMTDSDGQFSFVNLIAGGNYNVEPAKAGFLFTESSQDIVNVNGENPVVFTGIAATVNISGRVLDSTGIGAAGIEVILAGVDSKTAVTDANGDYSFNGLPGGADYVVTPYDGTHDFTPAEATIDRLNGNIDSVDFQFFAPTAATVSIGGRVTRSDGSSINNARISLTDGGGHSRTVQTNPFGYYRFDNVESGATYVVSIASKRFIFAQPTRIINVGDDLIDVDFIAEP